MGMPNMSSMGQGPMAGPPQLAGGPQLQMNGTTASAIHALPASLPGQSSSSALTQKLAATQDSDVRRTMLGKPLCFCFPTSLIMTTGDDMQTLLHVASTVFFVGVRCYASQAKAQRLFRDILHADCSSLWSVCRPYTRWCKQPQMLDLCPQLSNDFDLLDTTLQDQRCRRQSYRL